MAHSVLWLLITVLLVVGGCILYTLDLVGLAQLLWVLASGTAGATVMLILEERR